MKCILIIFLLLCQSSLTVGQLTSYQVCMGYENRWKTTYAPDSQTDVNFNNPEPVSPSVDPDSCREGNLVITPFRDDALRRLNYYRWLVGLNDQVTINPTNQQKSQECALIMAINNNMASPGYHQSSDPHTDHPGWLCLTGGAEEAARLSNVYSGQSIADPGFLWQTTPAHILRGFVDDFSSSKQGHRQNVLCPNLNDVSFGHVCYHEPTVTGRYFCGGCQWAYGRDNSPMPHLEQNGGFVAWPPNGSVPADLVPQHPFYYWSFAAFFTHDINVVGEPQVRINNQLVGSDMVFPLCTGIGVQGNEANKWLTWLRFQPPSYLVGDILNVEVRSGDLSQIWKYSVKTVDCEEVLSSPPPSQRPTRFPTPIPTRRPTPQPTSMPSTMPSTKTSTSTTTSTPTTTTTSTSATTISNPTTTTTSTTTTSTSATTTADQTGFSVSLAFNIILAITIITVIVLGICYYLKKKKEWSDVSDDIELQPLSRYAELEIARSGSTTSLPELSKQRGARAVLTRDDSFVGHLQQMVGDSKSDQHYLDRRLKQIDNFERRSIKRHLANLHN